MPATAAPAYLLPVLDVVDVARGSQHQSVGPQSLYLLGWYHPSTVVTQSIYRPRRCRDNAPRWTARCNLPPDIEVDQSANAGDIQMNRFRWRPAIKAAGRFVFRCGLRNQRRPLAWIRLVRRDDRRSLGAWQVSPCRQCLPLFVDNPKTLGLIHTTPTVHSTASLIQIQLKTKSTAFPLYKMRFNEITFECV